jgi:SWI/SNF-related matrix-associated actin-dependent regulator of chromatin subfamily A-like protein 1
MSGASHLDELQEILRSTIMIRRLKSQVLTELPPKRRQVIELDANGAADAIRAEIEAYERHEAGLADLRAAVEMAKASENAVEYENAVARLRDAGRVAFTQLSRLRHETALAKAPKVIEHVEDLVEGGDKVIVFAHHKDVIAQIAVAFGSAAVVH